MFYSSFHFSKFKNGLKNKLSRVVTRVFGNYQYRKYVVITSPRTGSNLLMSLLSSHHNVYAYGELFNYLGAKSSEEIWSSTFSRKISYIRAVGFKLFYDHPLGSEDRSVWDFIAADKNIKIIHLKRNNIVRSQISLLIAHKTNIWGLTPTMENLSIEDRRIRINPEKFYNILKQTECHQKKIKKMFPDHSILEVTYEELVADSANSMAKIFNHIEVQNVRTTTNLRKQNGERLHDLVVNYKDLKSFLQDTEFAHFLEE